MQAENFKVWRVLAGWLPGLGLLWGVASCTAPESAGPPAAETPEVLDDEGYDDTPELPTTATPSSPTPTWVTPTPVPPTPGPSPTPPASNVRCIVESQSLLPEQPPPLRVSFYSLEQLGPEGLPIDPRELTLELTVNPPLNFPISLDLSLPPDTGYRASAWLDINASRAQDPGDLYGIGAVFTPAPGPAETSVVLMPY